MTKVVHAQHFPILT